MINEIEVLGKEGAEANQETSSIVSDVLFAHLFILAVDVTGVP